MAFNFDDTTSESYHYGVISLSGLDKISCSMWVYPVQTGNGSIFFLTNQRLGGSSNPGGGFQIGYYPSSGGLTDVCGVFPKDTAGTGVFFRNNTNNALIRNAWTHVIVTMDLGNSNGAHIYMDGVDDTNTNDLSSMAGTFPVTDGNHYVSDFSRDPANGNEFDGRLAEMAMWTDYILTPEEIEKLGVLHYSPLAPGINRSNLVWYTALNRDARDQVGGRTATATGTPDRQPHPATAIRPRVRNPWIAVAAGVANPKGVFGHPLHGALGGPI